MRDNFKGSPREKDISTKKIHDLPHGEPHARVLRHILEGALIRGPP